MRRIRCLLVVCVVLVAGIEPAMLAEEIGSGAAQPEYFAVFLEGEKVGHSIQNRQVADGKVTTTVEVAITISRMNIPVTITVSETCVETTDGKPIAFECIQNLGALTSKVSGRVDEKGVVNLTTRSMGAQDSRTFQWPSGAVMAEGLRLLQLDKRLRQGSKYSAKIFDASLMQVIEAHIEVGPKQQVDLLGRIVTLTEVTTIVNLPGAGALVTKSYVDDDLRPQKTIMPIAGMQIEMVACVKEFALGQNDVFELVDRVFLPSPQPLDDVASARSVAYLLKPADGMDSLSVPVGDNQKVRKLKNGSLVVVVEPVAAPKGVRFPYKGKDEAILEAMNPNQYLQSNHEQIIALARRAVGRTKDTGEAARKIEAFVADYIQSKNLSVGYASATEVAESRQGDCSEFAVLTAAMCRAIGIPAQVVAGVAYVEQWGNLQNCLGPHAWVQAYVGDKWIGLDAAFKSTGRGGYGPGHIALAAGNGEPADFFNLVTTLGRFKIEKVIVNRAE